MAYSFTDFAKAVAAQITRWALTDIDNHSYEQRKSKVIEKWYWIDLNLVMIRLQLDTLI